MTSWAYRLAAELAGPSRPVLLSQPFASRPLQIILAEDSLVISLGGESGGLIACRAAFTPARDFVLAESHSSGHTFSCILESLIGRFHVTIRLEEEAQLPTIRYQARFTPSQHLGIPFWPKDVLVLDPDGAIGDTVPDIHVSQEGTRSGLVYFSIPDAAWGSALYFQNLTSLNAYCEETGASLADSVGGRGPELGFSLPPTGGESLKAGNTYTLCDAYVVVAPHVPQDAAAQARQFLYLLAAVYVQLPQPPTAYHDYLDLAKTAAEQLAHHKGCWTFRGGHPYLNAYVSDYKTPPESMVQLAVLLPLSEYCTWMGADIPIADELADGLDGFFNPDIGTIQRWLLAAEHHLDGSEEQKRPLVMDSWYLYHALLNLSRLALAGHEKADKLFRQSLDYAIRVAHHFNYKWPIFYQMETLDAIKAEAKPGAGGEKDVGGLYALVMLQAWELTDNRRYLEEAKASAARLHDFGFDLFYQANNTTFAAVAMLRLWKTTKEAPHLDLSMIFLANIFKNVALWECEYGHGMHFPHFFSLFPLSDAPYSAAYEEGEVLTAFHDYLKMAQDAPLPTAISILLPAFIRHALHRMPYYYPQMLPDDMLSDEVKTGEIDRSLRVPLEDVTIGREPAGAVGQEVYGAGFPFAVVPRHYVEIAGGACMLFVDYPVADRRAHTNHVAFSVLGSTALRCRLYVLRIDMAQADNTANIRISTAQQGAVAATMDDAGLPYYEIAGGQHVVVSWDKANN